MAHALVYATMNIDEHIRLTQRMKSHPTETVQFAAKHYLEWLKRRYQGAMRGNGTWRPLAKTTLKKKKYEKKKHGFKGDIRWILYQSGALFSSLGTAVERDRVVVGMVRRTKGSVLYRDRRSSTISRFHQFGLGRNPLREIVVEPDTTEVESIRKEVMRELDNLIRRNKRRGEK